MNVKEYAEVVKEAEETLKVQEYRLSEKYRQKGFRTLTEVHNGVTEVCNDTMPRTIWVRFVPRLTAEQIEQIKHDPQPTNKVTHVVKFKSSRAFPILTKNLKEWQKRMILRAWNLYALEQMERVPCYASADICNDFDDLMNTYFIQIFW